MDFNRQNRSKLRETIALFVCNSKVFYISKVNPGQRSFAEQVLEPMFGSGSRLAYVPGQAEKPLPVGVLDLDLTSVGAESTVRYVVVIFLWQLTILLFF